MAEEVVKPVEKPVQAGGPGDAPQFGFKYKDKQFATEAELTSYLDSLGSEITELKKPRPTPVIEPPIQQVPVQPVQLSNGQKKRLEEMSDEELVAMSLSNPKSFVSSIKDELREEYRAAEQARENMKGFWEQFWTDNKELKQYEQVVKMVFDGNMQKLGPLKMDDARAQLGELARNTVLTINKDAFAARPRRQNSEGRALIEGEGTTAPARPQAETEEQGPRSLTASILARRKARGAPAQGKAS